MEPVREQMPQQSPLSMYSQPSKPKGAFMRVLLWIFLGVVVIISVGGGAYFLGMKNSTPVTKDIAQISESPTSVVATPTAAVQNDMGIPITDKTVSFARNGTIMYLRYKGKIYTEDKQNTPEEVTTVDEKSLTWYGLVNEPSTIYTKGLNEIFSIKQLPDEKSFLFETRFESQSPDSKIVETITIYQYSPTVSLTKLDEYNTTLPVSGTTYNFPKIDQISSDGKYALFTMFGCWNCGGHTPEHMIMNLNTKQKKSLGKVSLISLGENGAYTYKEYVVTACPTPDPNKEEMIPPGECSKDPKDLPLLNGQM